MRKLSRREFVRVSTVVTATTVVSACARPTTEPTSAPVATTAPTVAPTVATGGGTSGGTGASATAIPAPTQAPEATSRFNEAPMLAERVAAGELPPVDERLPENPVVLPVVESIGKYGGVWRRGFKGVSDGTGMTYQNWNSLTGFNPDLSLSPMLAESWEVNDDATVWTWHLRAGTCWSDGVPLTTKDTQWWWDNHVWNEEISPSQDGVYKTGTGDDRQMCELEVVDDYTFVLKFAHPNPLFGFQVIWRSFPMLPGHYLEQFHADFADKEALDAMVAEGQFASWTDVYANKRQEHTNPEVPRLDVWLYTNPIASELVVTERNPYCWMVDEEGNQLPYIDYINYRLFETPDVFNMWIVNGEIDQQARHVDAANYTLFKESEEAGGYNVVMGTTGTIMAVEPNLTAKQPELRTFFNKRDVRFALNYAVNREEVNELIYDGLLTPMQYSPVRGSGQHYPDQAYAHLEYDPDLANQLLDDAGYAERNAEGFRVFPETGEVISFSIESCDNPGSPAEDALMLVAGYWGKVGVHCSYKYAERSLYEEHHAANEIACGGWSADRSVMPMIDPGIFIGTNTQRPWAVAWGLWRLDPTDPNAEEPPADHWIRDMWAIWDEIAVEPDFEKRNELFYGILDIWKREIPMQGYLGEAPSPIIQNKHMHNYVAGYPYGWLTHGTSLLNCATFFYDDPENH